MDCRREIPLSAVMLMETLALQSTADNGDSSSDHRSQVFPPKWKREKDAQKGNALDRSFEVVFATWLASPDVSRL